MGREGKVMEREYASQLPEAALEGSLMCPAKRETNVGWDAVTGTEPPRPTREKQWIRIMGIMCHDIHLPL